MAFFQKPKSTTLRLSSSDKPNVTAHSPAAPAELEAAVAHVPSAAEVAEAVAEATDSKYKGASQNLLCRRPFFLYFEMHMPSIAQAHFLSVSRNFDFLKSTLSPFDDFLCLSKILQSAKVCPCTTRHHYDRFLVSLMWAGL